MGDLLSELERLGADAAVIGGSYEVIAHAADGRDQHGGNPVFSAPMIAMGNAGSAVNLRELALVVRTGKGGGEVDLAQFGASSLGACELFRPSAVLLLDAAAAPELRAALEAVGVAVHAH